MIYFKIIGEVHHIFDIETLYSSFNDVQYFQKKRIVIQYETEFYTICFIDKKIDLLKTIKIGDEIEFDIKVKGRIWKKGSELKSVNELVCMNLNSVKKTYKVYYNNSTYNVTKYIYDENLRLKLVNIENQTEIDFSANCSFRSEREKGNHILFTNHSDKHLFNMLIEMGILEHKYDLQQSGAASGHVCKVLVMEKFNENNILQV